MKIQESLTSLFQKVDCVIISDPNNCRYLSGFTGSSAILIIDRRNSYLLTDFRYLEQAKEQSLQFDIVDIKTKPLKDFLNDYEIIGFEDKYLTYNEYKQLIEISKKTFIPVGDEISNLRLCKTSKEINLLRESARLNENAFLHILPILKPGISEKDIAAEIEYYYLKNGSTGSCFSTIAASGKNSSRPHAETSNKKLEYGDLITIDMGCFYKGYCSDMTRTVSIGNISELQKEVYNNVLSSQLFALSLVKDGAIPSDIETKVRDGMGEYAQYFGHTLGHGVGLEVHENPRISTKNACPIKEAMVITIEPGIYLEEKFGVRIEDTVVVSKFGHENLYTCSKELLIL